MNNIITIAHKELKDSLRNRWFAACTATLLILSSTITWFGASTVGSIGFTSIANTVTSLSSLNVFLIPLISLLMCYDAFIGEEEDGTLLLLLSYPISVKELIAGKLLGHTAIVSLAILIGFGSAACLIYFFVDSVHTLLLFQSFSTLILSAILLALVFISLSYCISCLSSEKSKAAGIAIIVWFFYVLIFDLILLGLLVLSEGKISSSLFPFLLLINPTDIFRLMNLVLFDSTGTGLLSIGKDIFDLPTLTFFLTIWVFVPLCSTYFLFKKRFN